jgi:hypothetical protein
MMDCCFWIKPGPDETLEGVADHIYKRWTELYTIEPEAWIEEWIDGGMVVFAPGLWHHSEGQSAPMPWILTAAFLAAGYGEAWYGTEWGGFAGAVPVNQDMIVLFAMWVSGVSEDDLVG